MKIGFLCTAYECAGESVDTLNPFVEYRKESGAKISVVHSVFKEFFDLGKLIYSTDKTIEILDSYKQTGKIDHFIILNEPQDEARARNAALEPLLKDGCDYIFLVDLADEYYTIDQIRNIVDYISNDKNHAVFKICLKNYIFDEKKHAYLKEAFTPNRIWKVNYPPFKLNKFYYDNNIFYLYNNALIEDKMVSSKLIPQNIAWIKHLSWVNGVRSKWKIIYQNSRWASDKSDLLNGDGCSYKSDEFGNLSFSEKYFEKMKCFVPEIIDTNQ